MQRRDARPWVDHHPADFQSPLLGWGLVHRTSGFVDPSGDEPLAGAEAGLAVAPGLSTAVGVAGAGAEADLEPLHAGEVREGVQRGGVGSLADGRVVHAAAAVADAPLGLGALEARLARGLEAPAVGDPLRALEAAEGDGAEVVVVPTGLDGSRGTDNRALRNEAARAAFVVQPIGDAAIAAFAAPDLVEIASDETRGVALEREGQAGRTEHRRDPAQDAVDGSPSSGRQIVST